VPDEYPPAGSIVKAVEDLSPDQSMDRDPRVVTGMLVRRWIDLLEYEQFLVHTEEEAVLVRPETIEVMGGQ
jgi:hypothetical protein